MFWVKEQFKFATFSIDSVIRNQYLRRILPIQLLASNRVQSSFLCPSIFKTSQSEAWDSSVLRLRGRIMRNAVRDRLFSSIASTLLLFSDPLFPSRFKASDQIQRWHSFSSLRRHLHEELKSSRSPFDSSNCSSLPSRNTSTSEESNWKDGSQDFIAYELCPVSRLVSAAFPNYAFQWQWSLVLQTFQTDHELLFALEAILYRIFAQDEYSLGTSYSSVGVHPEITFLEEWSMVQKLPKTFEWLILLSVKHANLFFLKSGAVFVLRDHFLDQVVSQELLLWNPSMFSLITCFRIQASCDRSFFDSAQLFLQALQGSNST